MMPRLGENAAGSAWKGSNMSPSRALAPAEKELCMVCKRDILPGQLTFDGNSAGRRHWRCAPARLALAATQPAGPPQPDIPAAVRMPSARFPDFLEMCRKRPT